MFKLDINLLQKSCYFHTASNLTSKPGRVMAKIMGRTKKKKFYPEQDHPVLPSVSIFGKTPLEAKLTGNPRRSNMLNKLFMKHITDMMATGEYSLELLGHGIEINKVKVSPDYKHLNVYWMAKDAGRDEEINVLLKKNAGYLRHELSALSLMGRVPNIVFVKDKNYNKIVEVQERLNRADFGEDHDPTDEAREFNSEIDILLTTFNSDMKAKLNQLKLAEDSADIVEALPPMPQNLFGFNHSDILKRVKQGMKMSKALHRSSDTSDSEELTNFKQTQSVNEGPVEFGTQQEQRKAFKAFLLQRQILQKKQKGIDKNWSAERDYIEQEMIERREKQLQFYEEMEEVNDFIVEENDFK